MNFPPVRNAVTECGEERSNRKPVPKVPVGIVQQRVGAKPEVFTNGTHLARCARLEQVVEGCVLPCGDERPKRPCVSVGQRCVTPQPVQFCCEIGGHAMTVFLGRSVPFGITQKSVTIHVKSVVVPIKGQIASVQRIVRRTNEPLRGGIKPPDSLTHVRFKPVRHAITVGIRHARVEVLPVVVFIQRPG